MTAVLHLLAPAPVGGLESVVVTLTSGLRERGHDVAVGAVLEPAAVPHPVVERLREGGVPVDVLEVPPRAYVHEVGSVRALFRDRDPDVVHTHGYRCDVLGARVARGAGRPVVSTVHGFTGGGWKNRIYERLQVRSLRSIDAVAAVSRPLAEHLRGAGVPRDRIHLVPNAWEPERPLPGRREARARLSVPDDAFVIGWVGRLSREKGADVLLRAMARLDEADAVAVLVGEGPRADPLRRLAAELGIDGRVRFHGRVPAAAELCPAFDVFALTSRTEGTPIVLFEAMEAEVPVIATRVGGVPDVVAGEEAILVDPDDPKALAEALRSVLEAPERARERAASARRTLHERFAVGPWLDRYATIYRSLAARSHEVRA